MRALSTLCENREIYKLDAGEVGRGSIDVFDGSELNNRWTFFIPHRKRISVMF